jgi:hypothetical protein
MTQCSQFEDNQLGEVTLMQWLRIPSEHNLAIASHSGSVGAKIVAPAPVL